MAAIRLSWLTWCCLGVMALIVPVAAADVVHHGAVDIRAYPWSSIGKIYNSSGGACTGTLIGPYTVLTAAHCIFNRRTQRFLSPGAIHFLLGYERGTYRVHAKVAQYEIGPGYDPLARVQISEFDWVLLTLTMSVNDGARPLGLSVSPATQNMSVMSAGFAQDRAYVMTADTNCHVLGPLAGHNLIVSDCVSMHGDSGAPVIAADLDGNYHIVAMQIAIAQINGSKRSIAVSSANPELRRALARIEAGTRR